METISPLARRALLAGLLLALTAMAYAPVVDNGFIWDDDVYVYESGYAGSEMPDAPNVMASTGTRSEFENTLIAFTPLAPLFEFFDETNPYALHRQRILYTLDSLPELASRRGPKFVFAHVVAPHPPFVFDAEGQPVEHDLPFAFYDGHHYLMRESRDAYETGYRAQATYIATRMLPLIDRIIAASERPAVIVLQGDHGPGGRLHHEDVNRTDVVERSLILNAYRVEDEALRARLSDGITPVNSFRVLLSHFFGDELPLQPDRTFYDKETEPLGFIDVTGRIRRAAQRRLGLSLAPGHLDPSPSADVR